MRIAIFTNNYLPNPYGITTSIESFRKQFESRGHKVFVVAPESEGYHDENQRVFRYPSFDINYRIKYPIPIIYSGKMDKKIGDLGIDIIHSQHSNLLGDTAMKWAKKKRVPIVYTWHTLYDNYTHYVPLIPDKLASKWAINNAVDYANKADTVVVPTQSIEKIIRDWGVTNKNVVDVPTGVESLYFEYPNGEKIKKKLGIKDEQKIIISISRLTKEKNVLFLLGSITEVLKSNPQAIFVFGGEGYLREEMQEVVKDSGMQGRIIFPGIIQKSDIKNYFEMADVFVYASKSETQGTIITEAMYCGVPIVALDATGSRSLIENNKTGVLVEENEGKFAETVGNLLKNKDGAKELGENAKAYAEANYTSEVCAKRMIDVYKDTIRRYEK